MVLVRTKKNCFCAKKPPPRILSPPTQYDLGFLVSRGGAFGFFCKTGVFFWFSLGFFL